MIFMIFMIQTPPGGLKYHSSPFYLYSYVAQNIKGKTLSNSILNYFHVFVYLVDF